MRKTKVVIEGGGENLYYVSEANGTITVYKGSVWGSDTQIGKVRAMRDARCDRGDRKPFRPPDQEHRLGLSQPCHIFIKT